MNEIDELIPAFKIGSGDITYLLLSSPRDSARFAPFRLLTLLSTNSGVYPKSSFDSFTINSFLFATVSEDRLYKISTDHFFTGDRDAKHRESDKVSLVNEYARTKYLGEILAMMIWFSPIFHHFVNQSTNPHYFYLRPIPQYHSMPYDEKCLYCLRNS